MIEMDIQPKLIKIHDDCFVIVTSHGSIVVSKLEMQQIGFDIQSEEIGAEY